MSVVKKVLGFTLVEAMIVAAILGILAAFAYPSYDANITRSKRADGMGALLNASNAMEKYRAANMTYVGATAGTTFMSAVPNNGTAYYNISVANLTRTTYTLTATPANSLVGKDGILTITQAGVKTWTDKSGNLKNCWPESSSTC